MSCKIVFSMACVLFSFTSLYAQDSFYNALSFDGKCNYLSIPHCDILNLDRMYTIEFWIKTDIYSPGNIINKWAADWTASHEGCDMYGGIKGWLININEISPEEAAGPFDAVLYPGAIRFVTAQNWPSGCGWGSGSTFDALVQNKWTHIAITVNVDSTREAIYVNGERKGRGWNSSLSRDFNTPGYSLHIGGFPADVDSSLYFTGSLDELRIWRIERTMPQIKLSMYDTLSTIYYTSPDSNLVLYLRFDKFENLGIGDDNSVDDIKDLSYYQNHADIQGKVHLIDSNIGTAIDIETNSREFRFTLFRNYPNPFNPSTTIIFSLPYACRAQLTVFDITGQKVATLIDEYIVAGIHTVPFAPGDLASGLYIYRLQTPDHAEMKKMVFVR